MRLDEVGILANDFAALKSVFRQLEMRYPSARTRRKICTPAHKARFCLIARLAENAAAKAAAASRPRGVRARKESNNGSGSRQKKDL